MASETKNLKLFKWDTGSQTDLKSRFDINKSLNENIDKIDEAVGNKEDNSNKSQTIDESTIKYPSNNAVKTYVEEQIGSIETALDTILGKSY